VLREEVDLTCLRKRPTDQVKLGLFLILISYVLGWPAVGLFGIISFYSGAPLILIVGGPLVYGFSHLVFLAGMYFAGKEYVTVFFKWFRKTAFEKILGVRRGRAASLFTENLP